MKGIRGLIAGMTVMLPLAAVAQAGDYPTQPIKIIVPFSAGGVVDSITRVIGEQMAARLGQPVIVENRAGAGGAIGTKFVAKSAPDGYTLLSVSPSHVVNPYLMKSADWSHARDFSAIHGFGFVPNVVVVPSGSPIKSLPELIALAKKNAAPVTYATAGNGTSNHLSGLLLEQQAGIKLEHVPYRGQSDALNDLLASRVMMMPLTTALAKPHIESGRLRPLAVTTGARSSTFPDLPTVAEAANLPGYEVSTFFGFVAPKGTPQPVIDKLSSTIAEVLTMPAVKEKVATLGMDLAPRGPKEFDSYLVAESKKWGETLKKAGIQPQ